MPLGTRNAYQIRGKNVSDITIADTYVLTYNASTDEIEYMPAGAALLGRAIFKVDGGLIYSSTGAVQLKVNE